MKKGRKDGINEGNDSKKKEGRKELTKEGSNE
jgi:hypothetical protein